MKTGNSTCRSDDSREQDEAQQIADYNNKVGFVKGIISELLPLIPSRPSPFDWIERKNGEQYPAWVVCEKETDFLTDLIGHKVFLTTNGKIFFTAGKSMLEVSLDHVDNVEDMKWSYGPNLVDEICNEIVKLAKDRFDLSVESYDRYRQSIL